MPKRHVFAIAVYLAIGFVVASFTTSNVLFGIAVALVWPAVLAFWAVVALAITALVVLAVLVVIELAGRRDWLIDIKRQLNVEVERERRKARR